MGEVEKSHEESHPPSGTQKQPRHGLFGRIMGWLPDLVVLVALALAFAQVQYDVASRVDLVADPVTEPARVKPPAGVEVPAQPDAVPVAAPATAEPDPTLVRQALGNLLDSEDLGRRTTALVTDLQGKVLFRSGSAALIPASNTKVLTSLAALEELGPQTRFRTSVRHVAGRPVITLVGGGDPYLASTPAKARGRYPARVSTLQLARQTATVLRAKGVARVKVRYDDTLFTGPSVNPHWPNTYVSEGVVPPIGSLWVDQGQDPDGYGYVDDPAVEAAEAFAAQLRKAGIRVVPAVTAAPAPASAVEIAHVDSASLDEIIQRLVSSSDNNATEVVLRHLGRSANGDASFVGGTRAVLKTARNLGVSLRGAIVYDGSGLSRDNRLTAQTLVDVLRTAAAPEHPELRAVITGLSVTGFEGSLSNRFDKSDPAARGRVIAKTGTLTGVHGLSGIATDLTGAPMIFAILTDHVPVPKTLPARALLDRFAATLGACRCAANVGSRP